MGASRGHAAGAVARRRRCWTGTVARGHRIRARPGDVFFLRHDVKLTDAQRSALLEADATMGGMFLTSDDASAWDEGQRATFERALATFVGRNG